MSDKCPSKYQGSVGSAAFAGAVQGLAGLIGLGSFWEPVDQSGLQQAQKDMDDLKSSYDTQLDNIQAELQQDEQEFMQDQSQYMQLIQSFNDELLNEKIASNQLLTQIIAIIVIIIIIYLVII